MEEAAKVIGGVAGELLFFARSFFLGFMLRMSYDPVKLLRELWRHPRWLVSVQDILFWMCSSFIMFGLLFRENNGTPRVYALAGILAGMLLYHIGPGRLTGALFGRVAAAEQRLKKIMKKKSQKFYKKRLKKVGKTSMIKQKKRK